MAMKKKGQPPGGSMVTFETILTSVTVTARCAKMEEIKLQEIEEGDRIQLNRWVREKRDLMVHFNDVAALAQITQIKVSEKNDVFQYSGFQFTDKQYQKLAQMVLGKQKVKVVMKPDKEDLYDEQDG
jgi:hypothetical protein